MKLLSAEKDRGDFRILTKSCKVQTKVFMRGDAINKHLSVGFWDLTRSRSLWEGRFHQKLPSPV